jgi:hypothetical protein
VTRVRRNALERERYSIRVGQARAAALSAARSRELASNAFAPKPRHYSARMTTGGSAPRNRFDAAWHEAQINTAKMQVREATERLRDARARTALA